MDEIVLTGEEILFKLGIRATHLKQVKNHAQRIQYRAIINWLTKYQPPNQSDALALIHGYIETLHHLCQIQQWEGINILLNISIAINPPKTPLLMPLSEYFFFKERSKNLLNICETILATFKNRGTELNTILILKARALAASNDNAAEVIQLLQTICAIAPDSSMIQIEAQARLAIYQIKLGHYQDGMLMLQASLDKINQLSPQATPEIALKYQDLKADLLDSLALYEMNASRFQKTMHLHTQIITTRKATGMIHKLIVPLVHQGVLMRKQGYYEQARQYLEAARDKAIEINNPIHLIWIEHHLAYVLIHQGQSIDIAEKLAHRAFEGYQQLGDQKGISDNYEQLGFLALRKGRINEAEKHFEKSLTIRLSIGNRHGTASSFFDLAMISWYKKQFLKFTLRFFKVFYLYYQLGIINPIRFYKLWDKIYKYRIWKRKNMV